MCIVAQGLATSTAEEARTYFKNLSSNVKNFVVGPRTSDSLKLLFDPDRVEDRKVWLRGRNALADTTPSGQSSVLYEDFIHSDMIEFSFSSVFRSLPNVVDGLKRTQRKILFTCLEKNITTDVKVAQLAGSVAELTAYHHGEGTLTNSIIKMAGDYVGANNVPLLVPSGQFGTRHQGGTDGANGRYIFTRLSPITRLIYPKVDCDLQKRMVEEEKEVEPMYFLPVIPMLLVNGSFGVGTGWNTNIPMFHPIDVLRRVRDKIR